MSDQVGRGVQAAQPLSAMSACSGSEDPTPELLRGLTLLELAGIQIRDFDPDRRTLRDLALSPGHLAVFVALLGEANGMGKCSISYGALASKAGVSVSTAQRATTTLEGRGLVIPEYRPFKSRRYVIGDVSAVVGQAANVGPNVEQPQKLNQP